MNLNIPNSLFMHAHVLPGKYLEMYLKFNDCRHYIQAFIYNPLWYKLTMLRHPALLCSLHVRFESVQVSFIFLYVYYHNLSYVCLFFYFFACREAQDPAHCMGGVLSLYHPTATATPHQHKGDRTEGPATE